MGKSILVPVFRHTSQQHGVLPKADCYQGSSHHKRGKAEPRPLDGRAVCMLGVCVCVCGAIPKGRLKGTMPKVVF